MKYTLYIFIILINFIQINTKIFPFKTIVTFGDANTDTGNVYNLTNNQWPLVPPYYQGCFSNGPLWIQNFNFSNILNYAYGGATIDNDNLITGYIGPNKIIVPDIRRQIVNYFATHDVSTIDLSQTVYIIWANGREYFLNESLSADIVVSSLLTAVFDLLVIGIENLIVFNLSPLQYYPGMNESERLSSLVNQHNNYLLSNITQIRFENPQLSIHVFDLNSLINEILSKNNSKYLFNQNDKCWNIINFTLISQCQYPEQYVFIDNFHFTTVIHQIIADNFHQFILSSSSLRCFYSSKNFIFICIILYLIKKF